MINDDELFEKYKHIGAEMVEIKRMLTKAYCEAHKLTGNAKIDNKNKLDIRKAKMLIDDVCNRLDGEMFNRFPDLPDEAMSIFYGSYDK